MFSDKTRMKRTQTKTTNSSPHPRSARPHAVLSLVPPSLSSPALPSTRRPHLRTDRRRCHSVTCASRAREHRCEMPPARHARPCPTLERGVGLQASRRHAVVAPHRASGNRRMGRSTLAEQRGGGAPSLSGEDATRRAPQKQVRIPSSQKYASCVH